MIKLGMTIALGFSLIANAQTEKWVEIGNMDSVSNPDYKVVEFDQNGNCYYAYSNNDSPSAALNVLKFDGSSWASIGLDVTSGAFIREKDMTFNNSGEPYVLFRNGTSQLTVLKFTGAAWDTVGVANFGLASMNHTPKIEFNSITEELVVAYHDLDSNKLSVQFFDGTDWAYYNSGQALSEASVNFVDLTIDEYGITYAGFANEAEADFLSIYFTYDGADGWLVHNSDTSISTGPIRSLAMETGGAYPVATYINDSDNKVYVHRLSGAPEWLPHTGGAIGTADFYTDIAILRNDAKTYIGFSDSDELYEPTTKSITDGNFLGIGIDDVDEAGFDIETPYNMVFGNDENDSVYVAFGGLDIRVFKLRVPSGVGINSFSQDQLEVYPNPANDQLTINLKTAETGTELQLISLQGKVVYDTLISKSHTINIAHLTSGTYILSITSGSNRITKKISIITN